MIIMFSKSKTAQFVTLAIHGNAPFRDFPMKQYGFYICYFITDIVNLHLK